jgi:ABC-type nitrate/sulfonate/bicarbonate transport system ATPase subunit
MFSGGGGAVDTAAFGCQVSGLYLTPLRRFLMLDEPLKHLKSKDKVLESRGALMITETSHELDLQVLMISHIPEQQEGADKVFYLTNKKGVTEVKEG